MCHAEAQVSAWICSPVELVRRGLYKLKIVNPDKSKSIISVCISERLDTDPYAWNNAM